MSVGRRLKKRENLAAMRRRCSDHPIMHAMNHSEEIPPEHQCPRHSLRLALNAHAASQASSTLQSEFADRNFRDDAMLAEKQFN